MIAPTTPANEGQRLAELARYDILDTLPEEAYDAITLLASHICDTPYALISIVDRGRQWFKSRVGIDVTETPRDLAFCAHAILQPDSLMVVPDATADPRFSANPLVVDEPSIRFYAGAPLVTSSGHALGTLCVIDRTPRTLDAAQEQALNALSVQVMALLELRWSVAALDRANQDLQRSNEDLAQFASVASHDLQAPVRNLTNAASLLREDVQSGYLDDLDDYLDIIETSGTGMQRLVRSILEYANVNRVLGPKLDTVALGEVARDVLAARQQEIDEAGASIELDELPKAVIDEVQAFRVLDNVIGNALKYRDPTRSPHISVTGCTAGASAVVTIADNGIGFDAVNKEAIFTMFRRLVPNSEYAGSGMGLAIAKRVVEQYGGTIQADSTPGCGSVFTIELPAA